MKVIVDSLLEVIELINSNHVLKAIDFFHKGTKSFQYRKNNLFNKPC
jgi:hypothetical protein